MNAKYTCRALAETLDELVGVGESGALFHSKSEVSLRECDEKVAYLKQLTRLEGRVFAIANLADRWASLKGGVGRAVEKAIAGEQLLAEDRWYLRRLPDILAEIQELAGEKRLSDESVALVKKAEKLTLRLSEALKGVWPPKGESIYGGPVRAVDPR